MLAVNKRSKTAKTDDASGRGTTAGFKSPVTFTSLSLIFDTNLSLFQNLYLPNWKAPRETVRDYNILYEQDEKWREMLKIRDNFLRRRVHQFSKIKADKIKVEALSTWGCPSARIFEIRLYHE